ncbi:MAG: SCO family protein [Rhizomicrobium sp.]|jgi:protein SCO1/2
MRRLRIFAIAAIVLSLLSLVLSACGLPSRARMTDIKGVMPPLSFQMTRASDAVTVDAGTYRGKVVILYFGYTHCPDECPTTLANFATAFQRLGRAANNVRLLFVTVDPTRDTLPVLNVYVRAFAPEIDGLRGSADDVAALARRYRVIYSVSPATRDHPYTVMHSASVFFFDRKGEARTVAMSTDDTAQIADQLEHLLAER